MNYKEIESFKNILKNYLFYQEKIEELKTEIVYLYEVTSGYTGVKFGEIKYARNELKKYDSFEIIEKKIKEEETYRYLLEYADDVLKRMTETNRKAIKEIYIYGKKYESVARKLNYSEGGMYKSIHAELKKL